MCIFSPFKLPLVLELPYMESLYLSNKCFKRESDLDLNFNAIMKKL